MPLLFDLTNSQHTGVAVMLYPDDETARIIAARDGVTERMEQLHVTLCYCGDGLQMTDAQVAGVVLAANHVAGLAMPFTANLQGIGRFQANESTGGLDVIYASVDSPIIETLRIGLLEALQYHGVELPDPTHGFTPHMTLAYVASGFDSSLQRDWQPIEVNFSSLSVRVGDMQSDFLLTGDHIDDEDAPVERDWIVGGSRDLPIADTDAAWDGPEARREMIEAGIDTARRGHLIYDDERADEGVQAAFRLPFARIVDGRLQAIPSGLRAAASRLPQTDAPQDVIDRARTVLDGYFERMEEDEERMNAWQRFIASFTKKTDEIRPTTNVERDTAISALWDGIWAEFQRLNADIESTGDNSFFYPQEIYVGDDGGIFMIAVRNGKLYRSRVVVNNDDIVLGSLEPVTATFNPTNRTSIVARTEDGRPVFASILSSAVLNKEQEIDSRALFDTFIERFKGDGSEYMNVYHLGKERSRIGEIRALFREDYLLIGLWVPDDTPAGRSVGRTLENDTTGKWGNSIEFLPDDYGQVIDIDDIKVRIYESGTLWGGSIVMSEHACAWFTAHQALGNGVERTMGQQMKDALLELFGDESILESEQFAGFMRMAARANEAAVEQGVISRGETLTGKQLQDIIRALEAEDNNGNGQNQESDHDAGEQEDDTGVTLEGIAATVGQLSATVESLKNSEGGQDNTIELTPEAATGIAEAVFQGADFQNVARSVEKLSISIEDKTKQIVAQVEGLVERVTAMEDRLKAVEADEDEKMRALDEGRPAGSKTTIAWRAPRSSNEADEKNGKKRAISMADLAERNAQQQLRTD